MSNEVVFVAGLRAFAPNEKAPAWIKAKLVVNLTELNEWASQQPDQTGPIRCELCESKAGKLYVRLDTFKPREAASGEAATGEDGQGAGQKAKEQESADGSLPF